MKRDTMDSSNMRRPKRLKLRFRTWDRLSTLPDEIICDEILSRLPIKTVASTSVLSHRWHHLWTGVSCVKHVVERIVKKMKKKAILKRYTGLYSIVQKLTCHKLQLFELDLSQIGAHLSKPKLMTLESTFRHVYDRNVEEFILKTNFFSVLSLPAFLLHSPSLVTLKLYSITIQLPENAIVYLPNLKHLVLRYLRSIPTWLDPLFRSSPLLESFDLHARCDPNNDFPRSLTLFAPALTSLTIDIRTNDNYDMLRPYTKMILTPINFYIDAPKLSNIDITDNTNFYYFVHDHCPTTLLNATLDLTKRVVFIDNNIISRPLIIREAYLHQMSTFIRGMYAIKHLELDIDATSNILPTLCSANIRGGVCSMFRNITRFTTYWRDIGLNGWTHLLPLLHFFPYLDHLHVKMSDSDNVEWNFCPPDSVPNCLVSHLKKINISVTYRVDSDLNSLVSLAAYILSHALVLEKLHFSVCFGYYQPYHVPNEFQLRKRKTRDLHRSLFKLPKRSSCEVEFSEL